MTLTLSALAFSSAAAERYLAGLTTKDISRIAEDSFNQTDTDKHRVEEIRTKNSSQLRILSSPTPANKTTSSPRNKRSPASGKVPQFTIQVGSYKTLLEAQARVKGFSQDGHSAFQTTGLVKGQKWFRVNLGVFQSQQEAHSQLKRLKAKKIPGFVRSF